MWQERWNNASKASSFYRSHTPNVNERPKIWASTRKEQVLLTRVRCDQLRLNQNLFKQGKQPTGQCDYCQNKEDVPHVLFHCPLYLDEREAMKAADSPAILSLRELLCTSEVGNNAVITFLKNTGIIDRLRFTWKTQQHGHKPRYLHLKSVSSLARYRKRCLKFPFSPPSPTTTTLVGLFSFTITFLSFPPSQESSQVLYPFSQVK